MVVLVKATLLPKKGSAYYLNYLIRILSQQVLDSLSPKVALLGESQQQTIPLVLVTSVVKRHIILKRPLEKSETRPLRRYKLVPTPAPSERCPVVVDELGVKRELLEQCVISNSHMFQ